MRSCNGTSLIAIKPKAVGSFPFHSRHVILLCESYHNASCHFSGFGSLEVVCWPLVPKFAGSNLAEAVVFFRAKKFSAPLPSEGK